jgi:hypothetical protein
MNIIDMSNESENLTIKPFWEYGDIEDYYKDKALSVFDYMCILPKRILLIKSENEEKIQYFLRSSGKIFSKDIHKNKDIFNKTDVFHLLSMKDKNKIKSYKTSRWKDFYSCYIEYGMENGLLSYNGYRDNYLLDLKIEKEDFVLVNVLGAELKNSMIISQDFNDLFLIPRKKIFDNLKKMISHIDKVCDVLSESLGNYILKFKIKKDKLEKKKDFQKYEKYLDDLMISFWWQVGNNFEKLCFKEDMTKEEMHSFRESVCNIAKTIVMELLEKRLFFYDSNDIFVLANILDKFEPEIKSCYNSNVCLKEVEK